jgi:multisubunit Na+/H+ antiporter MnhE subunit
VAEVPGRWAPLARRVGAWVAWWAVLMALWVLLDDSIALAELLAGAGAAALGAFLAELVQHQSGSRFRPRIEWVAPALGLPVQVARDSALLLRVLGRKLVRGEEPASGFREVPIPWGEDSPEGASRRVLVVMGRSAPPNTFVLGIDRERGVAVVHDLVLPSGREGGRGRGKASGSEAG